MLADLSLLIRVRRDHPVLSLPNQIQSSSKMTRVSLHSSSFKGSMVDRFVRLSAKLVSTVEMPGIA